MSKRHFSYRRGGLSGGQLVVSGKESLFTPSPKRGPVSIASPKMTKAQERESIRAAFDQVPLSFRDPSHLTVTKTSSPVAGQLSPAQANQNMSGSAVRTSLTPGISQRWLEKRDLRLAAVQMGLRDTPVTKLPGINTPLPFQPKPDGGEMPEDFNARRRANNYGLGKKSTVASLKKYRAGLSRREEAWKNAQTGPRGGRYYISKGGKKVYGK